MAEIINIDMEAGDLGAFDSTIGDGDLAASAAGKIRMGKLDGNPSERIYAEYSVSSFAEVVGRTVIRDKWAEAQKGNGCLRFQFDDGGGMEGKPEDLADELEALARVIREECTEAKDA